MTSLHEGTRLSTPRVSLAGLRWNEVEPGFHVANREGEFAGYVDVNVDGTAVAFDHHSSPIGRFRDVASAQASLLSTPHPANARREQRATRLGMGLAAASGALAATLALTAGVLAPLL
jgi:hypothetical protein